MGATYAPEARTLRLIRLLEADPALAETLPAEERDIAVRAVPGLAEVVDPGPWRPVGPPGGSLGALVVAGLAVREVTIGKAVSAEIVGEGDLLFPHEAPEPDEEILHPWAWTVLEPLRVAWLDGRTAAALRRWPQLAQALLIRGSHRTDRLAVTQAISQLTRVDERVLGLLWHLGQRWGRMTPHGVALQLRLTHRAIARLIGARRPSVTTAVSGLERQGRLTRRDDGGWLLRGAPPAPELSPPSGSPWRDRRPGQPSVRKVFDSPPPEVDLGFETLSVRYAQEAARASRATSAAKATTARSLELRSAAKEARRRRDSRHDGRQR